MTRLAAWLLVALALVGVCSTSVFASEVEVEESAWALAELTDSPQTQASAPLGADIINANGHIIHPQANPATANGPAPREEQRKNRKNKPLHKRKQKEKAPKPSKIKLAPVAPEKYRKGTDFIGTFSAVPINPTAHLQRNLQEDRLYVASILRAPADLGDPTNCKHSDIAKNELALKRIAIRINARRISLRQQQAWIDSATDGLRKIETEIEQTTATARNLAEQMDALTAQKEDITNHVRRAVLLKELDRTSSNLMRLKDSRMLEEVHLQRKHNDFALKNVGYNNVLARLHTMRTKQGLALGKMADPKPYRFAQVGMEAAAEEANAAEAEQETEAEVAVEADAEQEVEAEAETEQTTEVEAEAEAESE